MGMIRYINQVYLIYQYIHNFGENIFFVGNDN